MILRHITTTAVSILVAVTLFGAVASAEVIYATDDPFGGPLGVFGFDVSNEQSVAVRFTPEADSHLDRVALWLWNSGGSGEATPIRISLQIDLGSNEGPTGAPFGVTPGNVLLEEWTLDVPYTGFADPQLFKFPSSIRPRLEGGMHYWIVASSPAEAGVHPIWAVAQPGLGMGTVGDPRTDQWYPCIEGSVGAMVVEGSPDSDLLLSARICGATCALRCGEEEFCKFPAGACGADNAEGLCTPYPEGCPAIWDPVCGCDGETYGNECVADMERVSIDHWGVCD